MYIGDRMYFQIMSLHFIGFEQGGGWAMIAFLDLTQYIMSLLVFGVHQEVTILEVFPTFKVNIKTLKCLTK